MVNFLFILLISNTSISKIDFDGNKSINNKDLIEDILSKENEEFNDVNIDFDTDRILRFYETQGFFNVDVIPHVESTEEGVEITFHIEEGERPKIEKIIVNGEEEEKKLKSFFAIKTNDFFIEEKIVITEDKIRNYYKDRGYPYADVLSSIMPDSGRLIINIEKGTLYYVRNVVIKGLKICKLHVVHREIILKSGDKFSKSKLLDSQRHIYGLGFFGTITVDILKNEPDSIDLIFRVKELKSRILNFGIGLSIPLKFLISFGIEELNLFNVGHRFMIQPSFSTNIEKEWDAKIEGRYIIPHVTALQLTISILPYLWFEETESFTRNTRGNEFRISKVITKNTQVSIANKYKYVYLREKITLPDTIKGITNSVKLQLMIENREEFFNPQRGIFIMPLIEYAGGIFGGANDFIRLEIENRLYLPLFKNTIAQRLKLGVIIPTNGVAIYEKYYIGGQYSLRGYPEKSIGPDSIAHEKYGNIIGNYNVEARIALPFNFGLVGFFDIGYVDNEIYLLNSDFFKMSAGFGIRYYTPIGPARLDIGFPLANGQGREIYLGIYHIF
ncbi:BamA/TamA family outer membrane protein [candidate division WOR-3 bacterium]|nr:BamA/TamA family outer membrane protein [candidate division WOR-3 bacterium]